MTPQQLAMLRTLLESLISTATAVAQLLDTADEEAEAAGLEEVIPQRRARFLGENDN